MESLFGLLDGRAVAIYWFCLLSVSYSIAHLLLVESARGLCGGFVRDGVLELWIGPSPLAVIVGVLYVAGGGLSVGVMRLIFFWVGKGYRFGDGETFVLIQIICAVLGMMI